MTTGGSGGLQVVRSSLLHVAGIWDQQATAIGTVPGRAEGLSLGRFNAGVFQLIVSPYDSVVGAVAARCTEGKGCMEDIATGLRRCVGNYAKTESALTAAANQAVH
jgi:hypothetical protein